MPIDTDVTVTRVQRGFHAGGTQLEHYRFIKMTFENDEVMSIFLDSGVSAIGFQYFARNTDCYFGDNRERLKILKDTTVYVVDGE